MNSKELCYRILRAESEQDVTEIIASSPEMTRQDNWLPIDGRETNYNVVTNQAATGGKALTELCTNMVDAILLKHAHQQGIDPTGPDAPISIVEGVKRLVRLPGSPSGVLAEADSENYLRQFAQENLVIGITGGTRRTESLCFTFVDNGEGQHPHDFEDTFLSLSKGNKSDIPFVQGKYNMGSSGVLTYCGEQWYKLILSRRFDKSGSWGWTLVRRRPGEGKPVAEYFKPSAEIPTFDESLVHPLRTQAGEPDGDVKVESGTVIKLFDYQMESSADFRHVREALNQNLVSTVLPFRLSDYRVTPQRTGRRARGIDDRGLYGMEFLLLRRYGEEPAGSGGDGEDVEAGVVQHVGNVNHPRLGTISVRAIVLKKELPGWLKPHNTTSRVFHTVNGQVQFRQNRGYLSQTCKLPGLKDRIVVFVDSSELTELGHNNVWKGDRETVRATSTGQLYIREVTKILANSQDLRRLQERLAREEMEGIAEESQIDLLQNLVDTDPSIASLLPGGAVLTLPGPGGGGNREPEDYVGNYSPTFIKLVGASVRRDGAEIAIDGNRTIRFETDVADDYFIRPDNRGRLIVLPPLQGKFSIVEHPLRSGAFTMTFSAQRDQLDVGESMNLTVALLDDAMPEPVADLLKLVVVEERKPKPPGGRTPSGDDDDDGENVEQGRELPKNRWLTRDGRDIGGEASEEWPEGFTEQDGGTAQDLGDEMIYEINYDNVHFQRFLTLERQEIGKKVITTQYRIGMLVFMMGIQHAYNTMEEGGAKTQFSEFIDEIRRLCAQGAANVVMSIAKTFPQIINPTTVADDDE